jgi:hypothetical protein
MPGQELVDTVDRVVGDAGENVPEVGLRVEAVQGRGLDQGVEDRGSMTAGIGAGEQVVLAAQRYSPFILPMSGRSWKFATAGIPMLGARFRFAKSRSTPVAAMCGSAVPTGSSC